MKMKLIITFNIARFNANDTITKNRRRKPVPENRYRIFLYQFLVTNRTMALFSYRLMVLVL